MEDKETVKDEQLTPKKKRAMLEYMGIMFAVAFLLVAVSLFVKLNSVQHDLDAANSGARANIEAMEAQLESISAENESLTAQCEQIEQSAKAAELLAMAQNAHVKKDNVSFHAYMAELEGYADVLPKSAAALYNSLLRNLH